MKEETAQERHQRHVDEARIRGFVRAYDRTDWILAGFLSLTTWVLLAIFASPVLHPEFWSCAAIASGVRPADSAASGLGLMLARSVIGWLGAERGVWTLMQLGHAVGALVVGLSYLLMRSAFSARIYLKSEELLALSPALRLLVVAGALVFACSEALWIRMQFLSDELICLFLGVVAVIAFDRFRRHRRLGWHCLCSFVTGVLSAETPIGFVLAVVVYLWNRKEKRRYWARKGALKILVRDPSESDATSPKERADAVVTFDAGKADDPMAFFDEELEEEIKLMASRQETWLAGLVFLTGFVGALVIGGRAFSELGGLAVMDQTLWGYPAELVASWYRQVRLLVHPSQLLFALVFSVAPFLVAYALAPRATDESDKYRLVAAPLIVLLGVVAWTQLSPFAGCWYWTWELGDVGHPPESLRAFMAFFGASATMAALQVVCCACRRQVRGARKIQVKEGAALARTRQFCRYLLALTVVFVVALSVGGRRQVDVNSKLLVVDEYVKAFADQVRGLSWVFTDGAFDDALALELRAQGEERPHPLSMMSGRSDYATYLRMQSAEDDEDRRVLKVGALETLRFWAAERRERLSRAGLQLGFEVLVKCGVTGGRSDGLLLRIGTPDDDAAFDRGDAAARELSKKALATAGFTMSGGFDQTVSDRFDFILWRLARMAELRMSQYMLKEDGVSAAKERELVKRLDTSNGPYLKLKSKLERMGNEEVLVLSPQEGLAIALKRGDFNLARPYANRMLRLDPEDVNANFAVGMWAIENRLYGVALKYLETARDQRPDEPSILNNLAMVRFKLGDLKEALAVIEHAAKVNPDSKEIRVNRERILEEIAKKPATPAAEKASSPLPSPAEGGHSPVRRSFKTPVRVKIAAVAVVILTLAFLGVIFRLIMPYLSKVLLALKRVYDEWAVRKLLKARGERKSEKPAEPEKAPEVAAPTVRAERKSPVPQSGADPAAACPAESPARPEVDTRELEATYAERLWNEAREMSHNFIPDFIEDRDYLSLLCRAAELGHVMASVKLGDYAYRRGTIVEAYYWTLMANLRGESEVKTALEEMRKKWVQEGCPPEYENVREGFSEQQGVFARAVLRLRCGIEAAMARKRLAELEAAGCKEALLLKQAQA